MIPNKALYNLKVDRDKKEQPKQKKKETTEEFLARGGKVQKIKDKTEKKK